MRGADVPDVPGAYYDRTGQPLTFWEWLALYQDSVYRWVGADVAGGVRVTTQWLGLDHRLLGDGPPLIFETVAEGPGVFTVSRYATESEALAGHNATLAAHLGER